MFIITILFAVLTPFIFNRRIEQTHGNIINLRAIKTTKGKSPDEAKLHRLLILGYFIPTALLTAITMFDVVFSINNLTVKFVLIVSLFVLIMTAGASATMLEMKAYDLAAETRKKFDNSQSSEGESAPTHSEPTSHE